MMLFLVLLVSVRTVHLQVAVCFLFDVLPHMHSQIPVLILHIAIPALFWNFGPWTYHTVVFLGFSHYCQ